MVAVIFKHLKLFHQLKEVEQLSQGRVKLAAGTLYGALNTLLEKGWIKAVSSGGSRRKKEYLITSSGREAVQGELMRLEELSANGRKILGGNKHV